MKQYSTLQKWLLCIGFFACTGMSVTVSPIMQKLIEAYPQFAPSTVRLIVTVPSLIGVFAPLALSGIVGTKLPYKGTVVVGTALCLIGGVLPAVWNSNLYYIIFARFIFGCGFSVFSMRNAIVSRIFPTAEVATWMGYGNAVMSISAVTMQTVSGKLGDIDWRLSFALYLFCMIPLAINLLIFREPEKIEPAKADKGAAGGEKFNMQVLFFAFTMIISALCMFPIFSSISTFMAERNLGTAAQAGLTASACTLGQGVIAFAYGPLYKKFGRLLACFSSAAMAIGYVLILAAPTAIVVILGSFMCGMGNSILLLCCNTWAGGVSGEKYRAFSITLIACAVSAGSFVSTYFMIFASKVGQFIPLFSTEIEKTFLIGAILQLIMAGVFLVKDFRPASDR